VDEKNPTGRVHEKSGVIVGKATVKAEFTVERGVNELRAAVLFLLIAIGVSVGFGAPWNLSERLVAALGAVIASAAFVAVALRWTPARKRVMSLMQFLTGQ
jgi:hypothetical protein